MTQSRWRAAWTIAAALLVIATADPAVAAKPDAEATPSPAMTASPHPLSTSSVRIRGGMRTPRPVACPPGTMQVGPEDPKCGAFGDCCRPVGGTPGAH